MVTFSMKPATVMDIRKTEKKDTIDEGQRHRFKKKVKSIVITSCSCLVSSCLAHNLSSPLADGSLLRSESEV